MPVLPLTPAALPVCWSALATTQCIQLEAHATKGIGQEHAKWSPVATAWYRLQPEVVLLQPVGGPDAAKLAAEVPGLFSVGPDGQLVVGEARQHEKQLEKVSALGSRWLGGVHGVFLYIIVV